MEKLLLMAAAVHRLGPDTDISEANTVKVVFQALEWSGFNMAEIREQYKQSDYHPAVAEAYIPLVRMTQEILQDNSVRLPERSGPALFEGAGNWGVPDDPESPPCDPNYNSCRLTPLGLEIAKALLAAHPEYDIQES